VVTTIYFLIWSAYSVNFFLFPLKIVLKEDLTKQYVNVTLEHFLNTLMCVISHITVRFKIKHCHINNYVSLQKNIVGVPIYP